MTSDTDKPQTSPPPPVEARQDHPSAGGTPSNDAGQNEEELYRRVFTMMRTVVLTAAVLFLGFVALWAMLALVVVMIQLGPIRGIAMFGMAAMILSALIVAAVSQLGDAIIPG